MLRVLVSPIIRCAFANAHLNDSAIEVLAVWLGQALASQSWKPGVYLDPWKSFKLDMGEERPTLGMARHILMWEF